jgi:hypothetical protein
MSSFQVEIEAMQEAYKALVQHRAELEQQRARAAELTDSVPLSTAPRKDRVANKLHEIYRGRADADGGVQAVLDDYLDELDEIQNTIRTTLEAYAAGEREAIARYQGQVH